jgi:hypothetical protein
MSCIAGATGWGPEPLWDTAQQRSGSARLATDTTEKHHAYGQDVTTHCCAPACLQASGKKTKAC